NVVTTADISLLGAHYGLTGAAVAPFAYLDAGPTSDASGNGLPTTDQALGFDDLVMFAIAFEVVSAPPAAARLDPMATPRARAGMDELTLEAPGRVSAGQELAARLILRGTGAVQGLSVGLDWDSTVRSEEHTSELQSRFDLVC